MDNKENIPPKGGKGPKGKGEKWKGDKPKPPPKRVCADTKGLPLEEQVTLLRDVVTGYKNLNTTLNSQLAEKDKRIAALQGEQDGWMDRMNTGMDLP